jgi:hypothetical protein
MPKKKWEKPKLIVLVRGKPEEAVLAGCKNPGAAVLPTDSYGYCSSTEISCAACQEWFLS